MMEISILKAVLSAVKGNKNEKGFGNDYVCDDVRADCLREQEN